MGSQRAFQKIQRRQRFEIGRPRGEEGVYGQGSVLRYILGSEFSSHFLGTAVQHHLVHLIRAIDQPRLPCMAVNPFLSM